jgi:hypothetical protein
VKRSSKVHGFIQRKAQAGHHEKAWQRLTVRYMGGLEGFVPVPPVTDLECQQESQDIGQQGRQARAPEPRPPAEMHQHGTDADDAEPQQLTVHCWSCSLRLMRLIR